MLLCDLNDLENNHTRARMRSAQKKKKPELLHFLLKKQCNNLRVHRQLIKNERLSLLALLGIYAFFFFLF